MDWKAYQSLKSSVNPIQLKWETHNDEKRDSTAQH